MKNISEIKAEFQECQMQMEARHDDLTRCMDLLGAKIREYEEDSRKGVQTFLASQRKKIERYEKELERLDRICYYEKQYADYDFICGVDEVGRGPLAGPVVAGAVILPKGCRIPYINDSKKLSAKLREELDAEIREKALSVSLGIVSPERIDEINILQATYEAMRQAIAGLDPQPSLLLNDAVTIPGITIPQVPIIKGDAKSMSIGAASIVAKVFRDHMMEEFDSIYPEYHFASNKGYGSKEHCDAIREYGPSAIHRRSFIHSFL